MWTGNASNLVIHVHRQGRVTGGFPVSLLRELSCWLFSVPATSKIRGFACHTSFPYVFRIPNSISGTWKHPRHWGGTVLILLRWAWASFALHSHWAAPGPLSKGHVWCPLQHVPLALVPAVLWSAAPLPCPHHHTSSCCSARAGSCTL